LKWSGSNTNGYVPGSDCVQNAAPISWLVRLGCSFRGVSLDGRLVTVSAGQVISSRCRLGWSSPRGVGWAARLVAVSNGLVISSRCRMGWSSHRVVGWAARLVAVSAGLVVALCGH
jgi:hypothetical protein